MKKSSLQIILGGSILAICLIIWGGFSIYNGIQDHKRKEELKEFNTGKIIALNNLRDKAQDVIALKELSHLKDDIHVYIFNNQLSDLKEIIDDYFVTNKIDTSKVAYSIQDLTTDAYIQTDNARTNYQAASTYKLPLAMIWYESIKNGSFSKDYKLTYTENMKEDEDEENPNQPIDKIHKVGDSIPLLELLEASVLYSDNIAGHMLFEGLGGYTQFKVNALRYAKNLQDTSFTSYKNVLNPDFTMNLCHTLFNDQSTYEDLKYWMYRSAPGIFLNHNHPYGFIQKIGNIDEVRNVIGYLPGNAPFSISIYSSIGAQEGEKMIGDLGTICVDYFNKKYASGFYNDYPSKGFTGWEFLNNPPEETIRFDF